MIDNGTSRAVPFAQVNVRVEWSQIVLKSILVRSDPNTQ